MGIKDHDVVAGPIKPAFTTEVYKPPALRSCAESETSSSSLPTNSHLTSTNPVGLTHSDESSNSQRQRQRRPDRAVYVPRGRRSQTTPPAPSSVSISLATSPPSIQPVQPPPASTKNEDKTQKLPIVICPASNKRTSLPSSNTNCVDTSPSDSANPISTVDSVEGTLPSQKQSSNHKQSDTNRSIANTSPLKNMSAVPIKSDADSLGVADKEYNEEKELQRASKEINRRNRRIIKQTFDSDVLEINNSPPTESEPKKPNLPQSEVKSPKQQSASVKKQKANDAQSKGADADDDWESMFDDNGECLNSKVIDEISAAVGKVSITKPKSDYKTYQDPINLDEEEFPHVLEVSNFPVEFKTQDLMMIFAEHKDSGYDIKWVDDTHALVVFSSSKIAARVLNTGHSFVKLKPLTKATAESRARAKKSALFLQPYRQRPETCAALARRLVTGALGVRLSTAREELENERRVLREAKERKLLAAKQRDEAWDN